MVDDGRQLIAKAFSERCSCPLVSVMHGFKIQYLHPPTSLDENIMPIKGRSDDVPLIWSAQPSSAEGGRRATAGT